MKEYRSKGILTRYGQTNLNQPYFQCKRCKTHKYFANLSTRPSYARLSPKFTEMISLEGKDVPFQIASDKIKRIFGVAISEDTIRRATETIGAVQFNKQVEEIKAKEYIKAENLEDSDRVYVEIDASMLNTTTDGWKEYKLALHFNQKDIDNRSDNQRSTLIKKNLVGALALGHDDLTHRLKRSMLESGALNAREIILISDGAEWIETVFQSIAPGATMVLDWYHASEHLWECAQQLYKDDRLAKAWVSFYKHLLMNGCVDYMLQRLSENASTAKNQTPLRNLYSYFYQRRNRIRYDLFLKNGYFIGSGAIESAHKYSVQCRLKQAGMKWRIDNANGVAQLRNMYISALWDKIWQAAA